MLQGAWGSLSVARSRYVEGVDSAVTTVYLVSDASIFDRVHVSIKPAGKSFRNTRRRPWHAI